MLTLTVTFIKFVVVLAVDVAAVVVVARIIVSVVFVVIYEFHFDNSPTHTHTRSDIVNYLRNAIRTLSRFKITLKYAKMIKTKLTGKPFVGSILIGFFRVSLTKMKDNNNIC